ncbi:translation initiation factor IF-3 (plasmid) [Paenibacillus thiaminolyticus]|uniref:translation initiation factor IF-3 n=1 Tax=Paenibacillus thiaminolyticus TaxID=49283 RepID=UPI00232FD0DA|nr:translation initiation factor IF-3 [Paenibacillus thiaminolyticus]WCF11614.1 translation initiation factor IF-3 [Paenibacillus thiaminolyticus]
MGYEINGSIRAKEVLLVNAEGRQIGIMSIKEAIKNAEEAGLDLVNVSPTVMPPVCKMMDYGKLKYDQQKKERESRKKQKTLDIKEIRLSPKIDEHDFQTKYRNVKKLLGSGHKVKLCIQFRGREIIHADLGKKLLLQMSDELVAIGTPEQSPKLEGRRMYIIISPKAS